jgi:hypothetical protein
MEVADRCRIEPERLRSGKWRKPPEATRETADAPARSPVQRAGSEVEALRLAVHRPEAVGERLDDVLFDDDLHRAAFGALVSASTLHDAIAGADPDVAALLQRLAVEDTEEDADDVIIRLLERAGSRALADLQLEARSSAAPEQYGTIIAWLKIALEELRNPQSSRASEARLIPWLVARTEGANE